MADKKITDPLVTTVIPQAGDLLPLGRPGNTAALRMLASGLSIVSQGTVPVAVDAAEITLPNGYASFLLVLSNFALSAGGYLMGAFSEDGISFPAASPDYSIIQISADAVAPISTTDVVAPITSYDQGLLANLESNVFAFIFPGGTATEPWIWTFATCSYSAESWAARRTSTAARQVAIRIGDYDRLQGVGSTQIKAGSKYTLLGVVQP